MSTSTLSLRVGTLVLKSRRALIAAGAFVLLAGAGCQVAKVGNAPPVGGQGSGHSGSGGGNSGGGSSGSSGCGFLCTQTTDAGAVTVGNTLNCGDGKLDPGEGCDDGNRDPGDGCSHICQVEANFLCPTPGQKCIDQRKCGNGVLTSDEACDDGNTKDGDGCSGDCKTIESGWECHAPGHPCVPICGDSKIEGSEQCDDGNSSDGDGCSSTCQIEPGAACPTVGQLCTKANCGNGIVETGELCDCGTDASKLPNGCSGPNGLFYGDGKGCSKTCTKEPNCHDGSGANQACSTACGDGNIDPGEDCDDGNGVDNDGCSHDCKVEGGFTCSPTPQSDSSQCTSGTGQCLELPIIYRDFQPENVSPGGHPDFYFLGTKANGATSPTTICVPNSGGPAKGNDSTARCWDIAAANLLNGKPQFNTKRANNLCACQFSDWNIGNTSHIPGGYTQADNDSPLSDGKGGYMGGNAGSSISVTGPSGVSSGTLTGYTASTPGGPIFKGTVPIVKDANSFNQWFNDDKTVNTRFTSVLELKSIGTNIYQYASTSHLAQGGFFPLNTLNPSQATLCNLWPYWNRGTGTPIWATCTGDQYLFPPRVLQTDCPNQNPLSNGCWVTAVPGVKNDSYFSTEARYLFVYSATNGLTLQFFGDDDLFVFINGILVLDLGAVHQQEPGQVVVKGPSGGTQANIIEGGCLDKLGNLPTPSAASYGPTGGGCTPTNGAAPPAPVSPDDFRVRQLDLKMDDGKVYEIAIFGADRHPPESNYQLTLNGYTTTKSNCQPRCGDGVVSGGEECDCGDGTQSSLPAGCTGQNNDTLYGGCTTKCKWGPFCGDSNVDKPQEQCDIGKDNGSNLDSTTGCSFGCMKPHYCGDGILDTDRGEECDMGSLNNVAVDSTGAKSDSKDAMVKCDENCQIPTWVP